MPQIGKKHFPYTKKGHEAAEEEAEKSGKPMMKKGKVSIIDMIKKMKRS